MPAQTRLIQLALSLLGPAILPTLRRAAADPRTRAQVMAILNQLRSGVPEASPAARARTRLRRDLDATVELTVARRDSARDDDERAVADGWIREAQDIRHAADIAGALGVGRERALVTELEERRRSLLRRMLDATLPGTGVGDTIAEAQPGEPDTDAEPVAEPPSEPVAEPGGRSDSRPEQSS